MKTPELRNNHGLIVYTHKGKDHCLGELLHFEGRGVYDPSFGKVDVTEADAKRHNELLDEARIKGLDENCEIGMGGMLYLKSISTDGRKTYNVTTWLGKVVSNHVTVHNGTITFVRDGKTYHGRKQKDADCFNFRRIR